MFGRVSQLAVWFITINFFLVVDRNTETMNYTKMTTQRVNRLCAFFDDVDV